MTSSGARQAKRQGYIGTSMANLDGLALVTGRAKYTSDITLPRLAFGRLLRSTVAHAHIVSVDTSTALAIPGVLDVIVPSDTAKLPMVSSGNIRDMPLLADKVRYVGEAIGAVIAESEDIAEFALDAIRVVYDELPFVLDPEAALLPDAPLVHDEIQDLDFIEGNVCWRQDTKAGDIVAAFREADVILSERFETSKQQAMPMETHQAMADWNESDQALTVWSSTQHPHLLQGEIARVFGLSQSSVRVIKPHVGGAFGHKVGLKAHEAMAVLASRRLARPVRFALPRKEEFTSTVSRNPQIRDVKIAVKSDGTILGWQERIIQDTGAYSGLSPSVLCLSEWVTVGPYRTPALDIEGLCVYTNKPQSSAFRGFGNPQATFARELMFDICAKHLGMDPAAFRDKNLIRAADLPTETANGLKLLTLPIEEASRAAQEAIGYEELRRSKRPYQGIGIANMIEWGGGCRWLDGFDTDMSSATASLYPDGSLLVSTDAADSGQGHTTMFTQIAADVLGVAPENIRVLQGDTSVAPYGLGTFASRTAVIQGSALYRACTAIKEKVLTVAAHKLEVDADDLEVSDGNVRIKGTDRWVTIAEIAASIHLIRNALPVGMEAGALTESFSYDSPSEVPNDQGYGNFAANYTCSSSVVFVEVDPDTGKVTILDWAAAEDVGLEINPALLKGQVQGGIAQGIGYALGEDLLFDEAGTMLNPSMVDYQVPTAPVVPLFTDKLVSIESHDPTHPLKYKGIGESGMTPAAGAIACAILDAIGVPVTTLPLTPEKILNAIQGAKAWTEALPNSSEV